MLPISNIILASDLSNSSKFAFQVARAIASDYQAKLLIVHVTVPPAVLYTGEGILPPQLPVVNDDHIHKDLKELVTKASLPKVEYCIVDGDPSSEILRIAAESKADLIIMGTHGRSGLGRLLMGSVAEKVLRHATCPVLTVKTPIPNQHS